MFPKTVHIVMTGEQGEGGSIVGVYRMRADALKAARKHRKDHGGLGSWRKVEGVLYRWESGCDWLSIEFEEVW